MSENQQLSTKATALTVPRGGTPPQRENKMGALISSVQGMQQNQKPIGKNEVRTLVASLSKPKEVKTEQDLRIILQLFRPSMLMKRHKFKGRELVECLKRFTVKTVDAGDIIVQEGDEAKGFYIVVNGQLSKHFTFESKLGQVLKQKVNKVTAAEMVIQEDYPKYMNRELQRYDSMDFSPEALHQDIQRALDKNKDQATKVSPLKLAQMKTFMEPSASKARSFKGIAPILEVAARNELKGSSLDTSQFTESDPGKSKRARSTPPSIISNSRDSQIKSMEHVLIHQSKSSNGGSSVSSQEHHSSEPDLKEEGVDQVAPLVQPIQPRRMSAVSSERSFESAIDNNSSSTSSPQLNNPLFFHRRSSLTLPPDVMTRAESEQVKQSELLLQEQTSMVNFKVLVEQPTLPSAFMDEQLLSIGYSFGRTCQNEDSQKHQFTLMCATKQCQLAYIEQADLEFLMHKHKQKKDEKLLSIVRSLTYFKGVTRNTAIKIAGFFDKKKPCLGQVLIQQGDIIKDHVVIIVHKGELKITKQVQNKNLSHPISQTTLVHHNLVDQKAPVQTLSLGMLQKGCLTGLQDRIFGNTQYSISVECASSKGVIFVISGKKLQKLQQMTRIWQQIMEHAKKNCDSLLEKYNSIVMSRSKFPFGRKQPTAQDPEFFIEFRKEQTKVPNYTLNEKIGNLKQETQENMKKVKLEKSEIKVEKEDRPVALIKATSPSAHQPTHITSRSDLGQPVMDLQQQQKTVQSQLMGSARRNLAKGRVQSVWMPPKSRQSRQLDQNRLQQTMSNFSRAQFSASFKRHQGSYQQTLLTRSYAGHSLPERGLVGSALLGAEYATMPQQTLQNQMILGPQGTAHENARPGTIAKGAETISSFDIGTGSQARELLHPQSHLPSQKVDLQLQIATRQDMQVQLQPHLTTALHKELMNVHISRPISAKYDTVQKVIKSTTEWNKGGSVNRLTANVNQPLMKSGGRLQSYGNLNKTTSGGFQVGVSGPNNLLFSREKNQGRSQQMSRVKATRPMSAANQTTMYSQTAGTHHQPFDTRKAPSVSLINSDSTSSAFHQFSDIYQNQTYTKQRQSTLWQGDLRLKSVTITDKLNSGMPTFGNPYANRLPPQPAFLSAKPTQLAREKQMAKTVTRKQMINRSLKPVKYSNEGRLSVQLN